jgi:CheY-like chemotaxis protein
VLITLPFFARTAATHMQKTNSRSMTIVLAEDDEDDVYLFTTALTEIKRDLKVLVASNGLKCMELLTRTHPRIVFLDINMPFKTGLECLQEIRKEPRLKDLKVVMLSTGDPESMVEGADHYIQKGGNFEAFKTSLSDCLNKWYDGLGD